MAALLVFQSEFGRIEPESPIAYGIYLSLHDGFVAFFNLHESLEQLLAVAIESADHFFVKVAGCYFGFKGFFQQLQ